MIYPVYKADDARYEGRMEYKRCGRSGIVLPRISLGMWHNFGDVDPMALSRRKLLYAFDNGVTHFDLANNYGPEFGTAEETFGAVMKRDLAPYRSEIIVSTKAGHSMWPGPYGDGSSRKNIMESINQSLRRMNLEYVDIFYSHRYDATVPVEETMQALVDVVRSGKALYAGISKYPADVARQAFDYLAQRDVPCLIYQDKLNIFDRDCLHGGVVDEAGRAGAGFIAFSPLAQGLLTNRYLNGIPADSRVARGGYLKREQVTEQVLDKVRRLNDMAAQRGQTLAQMSLAWLLAKDCVTSVLVGASSVEQLADSIKSKDNTYFSDEELRRIDEIVYG